MVCSNTWLKSSVIKTEPSLSAIDILKLTPYVGDQIKEILPNLLAESR